MLAAHGAAVFPRPLGRHSTDRHARELRYAALHLFCSPPSAVRTPAPTAHQRVSYLFKLVHKCGILMGKYHWQMLWRLGSGARPFPTSSQTQAHAGCCGAGVVPAPGEHLGTGSVCLLLAISGGTASVDMDGRWREPLSQGQPLSTAAQHPETKRAPLVDAPSSHSPWTDMFT